MLSKDLIYIFILSELGNFIEFNFERMGILSESRFKTRKLFLFKTRKLNGSKARWSET